MKNDALNRALRPVARRIRLCRCVRALQIGLLLAVCAALLWVGASFVVPIEHLFLKAGASSLALLLLPIFVAACWPVSKYASARAADRMGLEERALTALTVSGESLMHQLQQEDAATHLASLNVRVGLKPSPRKTELIMSGALALITAALLFVPSPQQGQLDSMRAFEKKMENLAKAAEQRERPEAESPESDKESAELRKLERDLLDQIRKSRTERDAYQALDTAEQRMNRLTKEAKASSSDASTSGTESAESKGAGEADKSKAEQKEQSPGEAGESGESGESSSSSADGTGTSQQSSGGLSSAQLKDMSSLLNQLRQGVNSAATAQQLRNASGGSKSAQSQGSGQGAGEGQKQGQGQGQGQSQSQSEQGGSGASLGTTNKDAGLGGQMQNKNASPGAGMPEHRVGQYESIYDPTRIDGTDDIHQAQGQLGEGEISRIQLGPGQGTLEGDVPYDRVIGDYAPQAAKAAGDAAISPSARQWVRDYFDSLID